MLDLLLHSCNQLFSTLIYSSITIVYHTTLDAKNKILLFLYKKISIMQLILHATKSSIFLLLLLLAFL